MCQRKDGRRRQRIHNRWAASRFCRRALTEVLELRLALNGHSVLGDKLSGPAHPFPDGLRHDDPAIRAAIASITTTAPSDQWFFLNDFQAAPALPQSTDAPSATLAESRELIGLSAFVGEERFAGVDGSGYSVVVLDSGIDLDHPFFGPDANGDGVADRILYNADFVSGGANADDVLGHGTHVSSIIASEDSIHRGMAPGAGIIHLQVLDDQGSGTAAGIESALQWVVANAATYNVASVNMSLGFGDNHASAATRPELGFNDELAALAALGVITVSASGNDYVSHSAPGVSYPSADPNSLSIGAVWDADEGGPFHWSSGSTDHTTDADRIVSFSQRHSALTTVFAPGAFITGAAVGGGVIAMGGTSMAAPHVAGLVALMQQLSVQATGERLSVAEFAELLTVTGFPIVDGDDEDDNVANTQHEFRRIDVVALANAVTPGGLSELAVAENLELSSSVIPAGGRARVDFAIVNQSPTSTGAFSSNFYLSTDPIIDASDISLATFEANLAAGQSIRHSQFMVQAPSATAPGSYYLGLMLDDSSAVAEGNEQNNVAVIPITVGAAAAEIWMLDAGSGTGINDGASSINFGEADRGGSNVVRTFTMSNDGSADLSLGTPMAPAGFVIAGFPELLRPQESADFTVELVASNDDSQYAGDISFATNDADENPFSVSITGVVDQGDNAASATLVGVNSTILAEIGKAGDADWYKFETVRDVQYRIVAALGSLGDSVLNVYDADGATVLAFDDNGGVGLGSEIVWRAPSDGAYYAEVRGKGGDKGSYELSLVVGDDHGNDAATATATTDPSINDGAIGAPGDADWFSFAAQAGVQYRFEAVPGTLGGAVLRLVGVDGITTLEPSSNVPAPPSLIEWTAPESGMYYVTVEATSPSMIGSYELTISGNDDHGDNAANATSASTPETASGVLEEDEDVDWFSFSAIGGARYEFTTSGAGGVDTLIRLFSQNGTTELARDDNSAQGRDAWLAWTAPTSGTYFIEVSGVNGRVGSYDLSLVIIDDHGNDAAFATAISDPSNTAGVIESPGDADLFSFEAIADVSYRLEMTSGDLPASTLQLLDADGVVLATGSGASTAPAVVNWTASQSGRVYVRATAASGEQRGSYNLKITGEDDHGDNAANASQISVPSSVIGVLEQQGDRDWFAFSSVTGINYEFRAAPESAAAPAIRLYDGDGATVIAESGGGSGDPAVVNWIAPNSATYFLEVFEGPVAGVSALTVPINDYRLSLTVVGPTPGDYNGDDNVDGHDFLDWQQNLGSITELSADGNQDGVVDGLDLQIWRERFGLIFGNFTSTATMSVAMADAGRHLGSSEASAQTVAEMARLNGVSLPNLASISGAIERSMRELGHRPALSFSLPEAVRVRDEVWSRWPNANTTLWQSVTGGLLSQSKDRNEPSSTRGDRMAEGPFAAFDAAIGRLYE